MRGGVLGFVLGAWWLQQQAALPGAWVIAMAAAGAVLALLVARHPRLRDRAVLPRLLWISAMGVAGFVYADLRAAHRLADALAGEWEGKDVAVTGVIDGLPDRGPRGWRIEFQPESAPPGIPSRLSLAWYEGRGTGAAGLPVLQAGQRWRWTVRLRQPHGNANPHGFDFEAWMLEQGLRATGTVRPAAAERPALLDDFVASPSAVVDRLRGALRDRMTAALGGRPYGGVIVALVIGDQRAIGQDDWLLFNRTGIGHLVSISGLHITMIAAAFAALVLAAWKRLRWGGRALALAHPAPAAAAFAGALVALAYCLLAGWGVPAQRTFFMLLVVAGALWTGRLTAATQVLALALLAVVLLDPWAVMAAGFWLSFGAVGLIFYVAQGRTALVRTRWTPLVEAARLQGAITLGLAPLAVLLFQQVSLVGPLANAVAIPVVSFVVTPLALLGSALAWAPGGAWLLEGARIVFALLMSGLQWMDAWPHATAAIAAPPAWAFAAACIGVLWCLAPPGVPARVLGLLWMTPLFALLPERPSAGAAWITALDVGQGTAILVETAHHRLLVDTGPQFAESDAGARTVLPFLRARGIDRLDGLVVSHADNDHSGGARSVLKGVAVDWTATSLSPDHALARAAPGHRRCYAGQSWAWDGVRFEIVHPAWPSYERPMKTNARSCVVRVTAGGRAALLTGDIEAAQEAALLAAAVPLKADLLVVPHHGSRTSSTAPFIDAVQPRLAVFQVGYRNHYGHPRPDVLARYADRDIGIARTDQSGAVSVRLEARGLSVDRYRESHRRYWFPQ